LALGKLKIENKIIKKQFFILEQSFVNFQIRSL
jgi:hypothetical protein